ncbi:MAG: YigZ family protein [Sulfuricurvum sp.]
MQTVHETVQDTIEIKGSKFIAHLMPIAMYDPMMKKLRDEHPKAVHWVSAYRYLNEYDQIVEHSSDDGEPKGTSGKPTLSVLQGHDLVNAAIITVRYFGGTKLGPGGLVRAYADAANTAIERASLLPYQKLFQHNIECDYSTLSIVEYECTQKAVRIVSKEFNERGAILGLEGTTDALDGFYAALGRSIKRMD